MTDDDEFTPLTQAAVAAHEAFGAFMAAGFSEGQALYLVGVLIAEPESKPE